MLMYLIMAIFVCGMNIVPAFMPPTWIVLTFFFLHYHLAFFPTVIIGALMATTGRILLAWVATTYFKPFISHKSQENFEAIGKYFNKNKHLTAPLVISYAFLPIPSNQVFIAVGLSEFNIKPVAFSFLVGRLISYSFWVGVAVHIADNLENIFAHQYKDTGALILDILGFGVLFAISKINWKKILKV